MSGQISALSLLCVAVGCSTSDGTSVKGTVTYADGSPLSQGIVVLNNREHSFYGAIGPDGEYEIAGVDSGTYDVAITGTTIGGEDPTIDELVEAEAAGRRPENNDESPTPLIAHKYADFSKSGLTITVPGNYDITVSAPRGS